jgi:hypothetical protein
MTVIADGRELEIEIDSARSRRVRSKSDHPLTVVDFARAEGRFAKLLDKEGQPLEALLITQQDRLKNWQLLQELAGLR